MLNPNPVNQSAEQSRAKREREREREEGTEIKREVKMESGKRKETLQCSALCLADSFCEPQA